MSKGIERTSPTQERHATAIGMLARLRKQKACGVYAAKRRDGSLSVDIVGAVASSN